VALANLDLIEAERLVERVRELEPALETVLRPLVEHDLVGEVRTIGLLGGIELSADALDGRPDLADRVAEQALQRV
jgi:adenosylmethionine-8-amino-7-oxononanoate aminotransferase